MSIQKTDTLTDEEKVRVAIDCCYPLERDCKACPYHYHRNCEQKFLIDVLCAIKRLKQGKEKAETQLKELLSVLYGRTDGENGFTIYRKDILELAKDYGIGEEELK